MSSTTLEAESKPEKWTAPTPASKRNYPMNCWWVAAFADEVGEALLGRWLLDTPVLLSVHAPRPEIMDQGNWNGRASHYAAPGA